MTGSRMMAGDTRAALPAQPAQPRGGVPLPAQRGTSAATSTAALPGFRGPLTRALIVNPDPATARETAGALAAVGFTEVLLAAHADDAVTGTEPDPRSDVAAVSVGSSVDAALDVATLRRQGWQRILAVVSEADAEITTAALRHGATGAVWAGRAPQTADQVPSGVYDLSTREVEVLRMVADGRANKWIGDQLDLSALTVKSHLARIGRKLGTGERAHMVTLALRAGVIS